MREYLKYFLTGFRIMAIFGLVVGTIILFIRGIDSNNIYAWVPTGIIIFISLCIVIGRNIEFTPTSTMVRDEEDED